MSNLRTYRIVEKEFIYAPNVIGYFSKNNEWIVYDFDEKCQLYKKIFVNENDAKNYFVRIVKSFYRMGR